MARNDAWDAWSATSAWDAWDAWGGGGRRGSGAVVEGLMRSREGHLGRTLTKADNDPTTIAPALMRVWQRGTVDASKLPPADVKLMARLGITTRMQLYEGDFSSGLKIELEDKKRPDIAKVTAAGTISFTLVRPGLDVFLEQTNRVVSWAALRAERAPEILSQLGPQFEYWSSVAGLGPVMTPYTRELVAAAMSFTSQVVQRLKFILPVPRAMEFSARVQPMIEAPAFFAYPSGHATQAFMVARLLSLLIGARAPRPTSDIPKQDAELARLEHEALLARREQEVQLYRQAERIATNRVVAGVHYPIDSTAGCALGLWLADYIAAQCGGALGATDGRFDPADFKASAGRADFEPHIKQDTPTDIRPYVGYDKPKAMSKPYAPAKPLLADATSVQWLWQQAAREWHDNGYA